MESEEIIILDEDLIEEKTTEEEKETQNLPNNIQELALKITALEEQIKALKMLEVQNEDLKLKIKEAMEENELKKVELPNGTKITLVADKPAEMVEEKYVDHDELVQKHTELYNEFKKAEKECTHTRMVEKKGSKRKGYVIIKFKK